MTVLLLGTGMAGLRWVRGQAKKSPSRLCDVPFCVPVTVQVAHSSAGALIREALAFRTTQMPSSASLRTTSVKAT